jgi:alanine dehydrogenase
LAAGLTVHAGAIVHQAVAQGLGKPFVPAATVLG